MRRTSTLLALLLTLSACGGSDNGPTDQEQVRSVLETFASSVEKRDYQTICDDVFASQLLDGLRRIGLPCEIALRKSFGEVQEPTLTVGAVTVDGNMAEADVKTSARGQTPSTDTIRLMRIDGRWKVSALGAQPTPTPTASAPPASTADPTRTPAATPSPAASQTPTPSPSP